MKRLMLIVVAAVLGLAGCGGSDSGTSSAYPASEAQINREVDTLNQGVDQLDQEVDQLDHDVEVLNQG